MGIEAAGFDIVCSVEFDPIHCITHEYNFPDAISICKDVRNVTRDEICEVLAGKGVGDLDLIVGGPPCQGFSHIGKRHIGDPRNSLVHEFCRIVCEVRPKYFILENVPGIMTGSHHVFVDEIIREFSSHNYMLVGPKVVNATDYGVPQSRKRFFLMGYRPDVPKPHFPAPSHGVRESRGLLGVSRYCSAKDAIGDLEAVSVYTDVDLGVDCNELLYVGYRRQMALCNSSLYGLCNIRIHGDNRVYGHVSSKHTESSRVRFDLAEQGGIEKTSRFFKLHPDLPCNTLRAGTASDRGAFTAPRPIHYSIPRCISIREAARLHGYPDWFRLHATIWHGFREIGNSLPPLMARALGDSIRESLGIRDGEITRREVVLERPERLSYNMSEACGYYGVSNPIAQRSRKNGTG